MECEKGRGKEEEKLIVSYLYVSSDGVLDGWLFFLRDIQTATAQGTQHT